MGQAATGIGAAAAVDPRQESNGGMCKTAAVGVDPRQESISGRRRSAAAVKQQLVQGSAVVEPRQVSNSGRGQTAAGDQSNPYHN